MDPPSHDIKNKTTCFNHWIKKMKKKIKKLKLTSKNGKKKCCKRERG